MPGPGAAPAAISSTVAATPRLNPPPPHPAMQVGVCAANGACYLNATGVRVGFQANRTYPSDAQSGLYFVLRVRGSAVDPDLGRRRQICSGAARSNLLQVVSGTLQFGFSVVATYQNFTATYEAACIPFSPLSCTANNVSITLKQYDSIALKVATVNDPALFPAFTFSWGFSATPLEIIGSESVSSSMLAVGLADPWHYEVRSSPCCSPASAARACAPR